MVDRQSIVVGRHPRATLLRAAALAAAAFLTFRYLLLPIRLEGISMLPSYTTGTLNFVNTLPYRWRAPRRGDVVAIRMAGRQVMYVKRLVGLPGERIEFEHGFVQIQGEPLDEPYVRNRGDWNLPGITLGPDEYFVVGDNRGMRIEEHELGRARRERLVGPLLY